MATQTAVSQEKMSEEEQLRKAIEASEAEELKRKS